MNNGFENLLLLFIGFIIGVVVCIWLHYIRNKSIEEFEKNRDLRRKEIDNLK